MGDSLTSRALAATILFVGFWVLALGTVVFLFLAPLWLWRTVEFVRIFPLGFISLCFFFWIAGGIIAISILPRYKRFVPPGPELKPSEQPRLFELLKDIASSTGEALPSKVYLSPDVNASVADVGGWLGLGSRRMMFLGLPLLYGLSPSQLKTVLAHEFGHYKAGDTRLGPWLHHNFSVIARVVSNLASFGAPDDHDDTSSGRLRMFMYLVNLPFLSYGNFVLKRLRLVAREQEYLADRIAAEVVNPTTARDTLTAITGLARSYHEYWSSLVLPVLDLGYKLPIGGGFQKYLTTSQAQKFAEQEIRQVLEEQEPNPYDTHPTLKERLAALSNLNSPHGQTLLRQTSIAELLENVEGLEMSLLQQYMPKKAPRKIEPISWDRVAEGCYLPYWQKLVQEKRSVLGGIKISQLPQTSENLLAFARQLGEFDEGAGILRKRASDVLASALAFALHRQGFAAIASPDKPVQLIRGPARLEPVTIIWRMDSGELTANEWIEQMNRFNISDAPLSE